MNEHRLSNRGDGEAKWSFPPIHPEGRKFGVIAAVITALAFLILPDIFGWLLAGVTIWVIAFFRDPVRVTPQGDRLVISPADGLVTLIADVPPPPEMRGADGLGDAPMIRVSIFMSVFDVHVNRAPIGGTVKRVAYIAGKFLNADLDKASEENERQHVLIERGDGVRIGMTQIAGLVARRIVTYIKDGDMLAGGQRIGLIRFGSRVDVYLPAGTTPRIVKGQRAIAGETVIAELGQAPLIEGIAQ
ncbi:phosphatidylserine decarboxylase [Novosphingopyxis sp.]|uniref:phosphatidylserine decarboxylase n=1 Tax=Novosphingopyxis sp. TaxID=2709690 RepID=UPI003B594539